MLDCPKYDTLRGDLWRRLQGELAPERWQALQQKQSDDKAFALIDCVIMGGSVIEDIIAPYVYACWQLRWKVRNDVIRSDERGADGSDARA